MVFIILALNRLNALPKHRLIFDGVFVADPGLVIINV
jgi:hypothetical protein